MTVNRMIYEVNQRLYHLFNKENWVFEKPSYHVNTGIKVVDHLVDMMVKAEPYRYRWPRKIARSLLQALNQSRIPASLYVKTQYALGERSRQLVRDFTSITAPKLQPQWAY
jgi:hypothetical protein